MATVRKQQWGILKMIQVSTKEAYCFVLIYMLDKQNLMEKDKLIGGV